MPKTTTSPPTEAGFVVPEPAGMASESQDKPPSWDPLRSHGHPGPTTLLPSWRRAVCPACEHNFHDKCKGCPDCGCIKSAQRQEAWAAKIRPDRNIPEK